MWLIIISLFLLLDADKMDNDDPDDEGEVGDDDDDDEVSDDLKSTILVIF